MAQTIAKLNIHLGATTAALQKGFNQGSKALAAFGSTAIKAAERISEHWAKAFGKMGKSLSGGFGFGAALSSISSISYKALMAVPSFEKLSRWAQKIVRAFMAIDASKLGPLEGARVKMAQDALTRLGDRVRQMWHAVAAELSPAITALVTQFLNAGISGESMGASIASGVETAVMVLGKLGDAILGIRAAWNLTQHGAEKFFTLFTGAFFDKEWQRMADKKTRELNASWEDAVSGGFSKRLLKGIEDAKAAAAAMSKKVAEDVKDSIASPDTARDIGRAMSPRAPGGVGAAIRGSLEAFSATQAAARQALLEKQQLEVQQKQLLALEALKTIMRNQAPVIAMGF